MDALKETQHYKIYWYDDEQTILMGEAYTGWTWTSANEGVAFINATLEEPSKTHDTYVIIHLTTDAQLMPRNQSTFMALRNLIQEDPKHEQLTIYITGASVLNTLMKIVAQLYRIGDKTTNYRFVQSIDEALRIVHEHKKSRSTPPPPPTK